MLTIIGAYAIVYHPYLHIFGTKGGALDYCPSGALEITEPKATYSSLTKALEVEGLIIAAPTWIPERFSLDTVETLDTLGGVSVFGWFTSDSDDTLSIIYLSDAIGYSVTIENDSNLGQTLSQEPVSEKDASIELFYYNDREHILKTNLDIPVAEWYHNGVKRQRPIKPYA